MDTSESVARLPGFTSPGAWLAGVFLSVVLASMPGVASAEKVSFHHFCQALAGHWQGSSAMEAKPPQQVSVSCVCSRDRRQLLVSVGRGANHPFSETWWFRDRGEQVLLTFYDGVDEDRQQSFSLYRNNGSFSLLGQGQINRRPALIQLRFEPRGEGWLWLQNAQYLDEDVERYRFYRGIEMAPVPNKD